MLDNFHDAGFFDNKLLKKIFSGSNSLDSDQNIVPDLGPKCSQRLSADDKSHHSRQRLKKSVSSVAGEKTYFSQYCI